VPEVARVVVVVAMQSPRSGTRIGNGVLVMPVKVRLSISQPNPAPVTSVAVAEADVHRLVGKRSSERDCHRNLCSLIGHIRLAPADRVCAGGGKRAVVSG